MSLISSPDFFRHSITRSASISFSLNLRMPEERSKVLLYHNSEVWKSAVETFQIFVRLYTCEKPPENFEKTLDLKLSLGINMTVSQENNNVNGLLGG